MNEVSTELSKGLLQDPLILFLFIIGIIGICWPAIKAIFIIIVKIIRHIIRKIIKK